MDGTLFLLDRFVAEVAKTFDERTENETLASSATLESNLDEALGSEAQASESASPKRKRVNQGGS